MTPLLPTPSEAAFLRFLLPLGDVRNRFVIAGSLFGLGLLAWCLVPGPLSVVGLPLILAGHLPLWARTQTTAPGGATPAHEDVWAPVEDDWLDRVSALEERGARWDVTPWDVSNRVGCVALLGVLLLVAILAFVLGALVSADALLRTAVAALLLLVPLWINGIRTTWNPSELRKKGEALAVARAAVAGAGGADFEVVPLLALREGRRGKYPVDARLMARPATEDSSGFLGVQVQVAMNNVRGTDYPYLYAVVLGKEGFRLPQRPGRQRVKGVDLVTERGKSEGVVYLVLRQHADRSGGWHTDAGVVDAIVRHAIETGREAWRSNAEKAR
jgi:hypothetical protein